MRLAYADVSFIVFDTLTLDDDRLESFYDNPNALRYYFRDIGRMVLAAEGRKANDSHADCYQYFCVPEYGTANGSLHFHAVHFMRTLPTGSVDPNFGRRVRNRRQLNSLQNTWPYGYSMPIAVRYTQDAFSCSGWLWPVDAREIRRAVQQECRARGPSRMTSSASKTDCLYSRQSYKTCVSTTDLHN